MIMPHEFRGCLNRVVRGLRLRLTNGPLRPARNAARMDLVSPGLARIAAQIEVLSLRLARNATRYIRTVGVRITDQVDQMSPESNEDYRSGPRLLDINAFIPSFKYRYCHVSNARKLGTGSEN
ncbi:unnamed protein product, partial [Prunus brigantina]